MRALRDRRTLTFAARLPLTSALALEADEAIVLDGAGVVASGAPAEIASRERAFALRVRGAVAAFVAGLRARGAKAEAAHAGAPTAHVTVDLGDLKTTDLFAIAADTSAVVVEMRPLSGAF
jgi:hypothetical protein